MMIWRRNWTCRAHRVTVYYGTVSTRALYTWASVIGLTNAEIKPEARRDHAAQVQPADDAEDQTHEQLEPDHPDVGVAEHVAAAPPPRPRRLLGRRPRREPAEPDVEAPRQRGDDQIILRDRRVDKVRPQEAHLGWCCCERAFRTREGCAVVIRPGEYFSLERGKKQRCRCPQKSSRLYDYMLYRRRTHRRGRRAKKCHASSYTSLSPPVRRGRWTLACSGLTMINFPCGEAMLLVYRSGGGCCLYVISLSKYKASHMLCDADDVGTSGCGMGIFGLHFWIVTEVGSINILWPEE